MIMLRNPYGSDPEAYRKEGTLENRFCKVITLALQYMNQNVEDLFYEGKESEKPASTGKEESIKLTSLAKGALSRFFFGPEGFIKDNFGKNEGFAFELREARRRLRAGEKPFFHYPRRIFEKVNGKDEGKEVRQETLGLDEQRIMEIVNKRVDQRLAEMGFNLQKNFHDTLATHEDVNRSKQDPF
ncbi:MAG: hypothetical protein NTV25_02855 [Methanothrix sp.]|nr:hypothetical protein [Methanothrix sp.]